MLEDLLPDVLVTNEPVLISCWAPDYILTKKNVPISYVEINDINGTLEITIFDTTIIGLLGNIYEAVEGCLSIDIKNIEITEKDRILEIAV